MPPVTAQAADGALLAKLDCPDRVKDVVFSPDGKLLAAGFGWNDQGGARIWNVANHEVVATLTVGKGDGANIEHVAFSPDGKLFAAANWNGDVDNDNAELKRHRERQLMIVGSVSRSFNQLIERSIRFRIVLLSY